VLLLAGDLGQGFCLRSAAELREPHTRSQVGGEELGAGEFFYIRDRVVDVIQLCGMRRWGRAGGEVVVRASGVEAIDPKPGGHLGVVSDTEMRAG